jgi:phosphoglycerate dehydrogenase-like enzyme
VTDAPRRRHRALPGAGADAPDVALDPGPVAVLPDGDPGVAEAVRAGGGMIAPLDARTRGIVWTAASGADELARILDEHLQVAWVQLPWAGVDAFAGLLERFADDGRVWTSAKGAYAQPVAEHALMLALAVLRELPRRARARRWDADERGRTLFGAEVVVIGAGGIAVELLRLLSVFDVRATVVRRRLEPVPGAARTITVEHLGEALARAELVFVAAALTDRTRRLIGAEELDRMPEGAILVNVARGALVDTDALVAALESGRLGGAGLDVTDPEPLPAGHPLWSVENCVVTPHVADTAEMTAPLFAERVTRNTAAFLGDGRFEGVIDREAGY